MAKYVIEEMNDLNGAGIRNYPRIQLQGRVELMALAKQISKSGSFTVGDILGIVYELNKQIANTLSQGHSVKIDGLGIFNASLGLKKGKSKEGLSRRNAQSLQVRGVTFRPQKEFLQDINTDFRPQRSRRAHPRQAPITTQEERLLLALDFLQTHPYLRVADYRALTGLLPTTARKELRQLAETPQSGITASGSGSHKVYIRTLQNTQK